MPYCFSANYTYVGTDDDVLIIGFADDQFEPSSWITLQLAETFDEQDIATGSDKIYIEVDDQGRSQYGGITSMKLAQDLLEIHLDEGAQQKLGVDGPLKVSLTESDFSFDSLKEAVDIMVSKQSLN